MLLSLLPKKHSGGRLIRSGYPGWASLIRFGDFLALWAPARLIDALLAAQRLRLFEIMRNRFAPIQAETAVITA
jgi:hypothetical protein